MTEVPATDISEQFLTEINGVCSRGVDVLDAVLSWCNKHDIDVESVAHLIKRDQSLKARLQCEAETLHMVKVSGSRLPL